MQSITGTWQLVNTESVAADGSLLAPPYGGASSQGLVSLRDGRLICVLCGTEERAPGQPPEYNSYCGPYKFDGKRLITRVDACSDPAFMGTDQIRDVSFDGEVMVLRPAEGTGPADKGQRILYWIKLPDIEA